MGSPTLKKCTIADWKELLGISKLTFENSFGSQNKPSDMKIYTDKVFNEEHIKTELNHPKSAFYFVMIGEIVVGYFKLNWEEAQSDQVGRALEIERIYLLAAYQGLSIGQFMMNKVFEIARKENKLHLWLGVWEQNEGAVRFYKRNGFKAFSEHSFLLGTDLQTDLLMELKLDNG